MNGMFYRCSSLTSLDVTHFNTANVTNMNHLFRYCSKLTSLDVTSFNTENVTTMSCMFMQCYGLTSLDLSSFNTENVTDMSYMFTYCDLTGLDLSNFNTEKVTNMYAMFYDCSSLTSLDLSNFNTANVTDMRFMFQDCSELTTIYAGDGWNTNLETSSEDMFSNCTSLVGGNGTTYDASHIDKEYARIDGGTSNPGYFSKHPEAYAELSTDGSTLTFYCDGNRSSRTDPIFDWRHST